jgi:hypothetical protein
LIVLGELAIAMMGNFQPPQQRWIGGALLGGQRCSGCPAGQSAQALDLGFDVGLGVEPGAGDLGLTRDDLKVTGAPA